MDGGERYESGRVVMRSRGLVKLGLRRVGGEGRSEMWVGVKQEVMVGYIRKEGSGETVDKDLSVTGDSRDHYFVFCRRYKDHVECLFSGSVDYGRVMIDWQSTSGIQLRIVCLNTRKEIDYNVEDPDLVLTSNKEQYPGLDKTYSTTEPERWRETAMESPLTFVHKTFQADANERTVFSD